MFNSGKNIARNIKVKSTSLNLSISFEAEYDEEWEARYLELRLYTQNTFKNNTKVNYVSKINCFQGDQIHIVWSCATGTLKEESSHRYFNKILMCRVLWSNFLGGSIWKVQVHNSPSWSAYMREISSGSY